jgi:TRAP-type C4-dicarboxylate transport system permease small subunit
MRNGLEIANRLAGRVEDLMLRLAGLTTFAIMLIVGVDVLMRYALNAPFSWSYDLIGIYLVPLSFFFALSATFRRNHHISVDILYRRYPLRLQRLARLATALLFGPFVLWMIWLAARDAHDRYAAGDAISGTILWPTWIPSAIVALGFLALVLRLALDTIALLVSFAHGTDDVPGESPARAVDAIDAEDRL